MFTKLDIELPDGPYNIGQVKDSIDGLDIEIICRNEIIIFRLAERILFRIIDESIIFDEMISDCEFTWPIYEGSQQTEFYKFFQTQSGEAYEDLGYRHLRFFGEEEIIDIITKDFPEKIFE